MIRKGWPSVYIRTFITSACIMIGLVVVQIVVVWAWGVEPRNRGIEEVAAATV